MRVWIHLDGGAGGPAEGFCGRDGAGDERRQRLHPPGECRAASAPLPDVNPKSEGQSLLLVPLVAQSIR